MSGEEQNKMGDGVNYKESIEKDCRFTTVVDSKYDDHHKTDENRLLATIKYEFKVILVGDASVGKTSLFTRFTRNEYKSDSIASVSLVSEEKNLNLDQSTVANLQIWDTCGEEKFRHIGRAYFKNIHGAMIVFDVTHEESFEALDIWIDDVKNNAPEDAIIIIVGNKADDSSNRKITSKKANEYASKKGLEYYDVSAKTGNNVALSFEMLTNKVQTKFEEGGFKNMLKKNHSLKTEMIKAIKDTDSAQKTKKGCC